MRNVQIIGIGDFKTKLLRKNVDEALKSHSGDITVTNITEINQIKFYAITSTPALSIDGHIVSQGEVPSVDEIRALFENRQVSLSFQKPESVMVACDFTPHSEQVLTYAFQLAEHFGASLEVVHILPVESTPLTSLDFTDINMKKSALQKVLRSMVEKIRAVEGEKNLAIGKIPVSYTVLNGQPARELILLSQKAELMVSGTSGSTGHLFGDTAIELAAGAHCPVIFVPHQYFYNGISRVVYGCTDKAVNKKAIRSVCNFSTYFGATLDFIHVGAESEMPKLKQRLEDILNEIREKPGIGDFYFTENKPVVRALMDYAASFKPDLLVLEHDRGRRALEKLFSGSVTTKAVDSIFSIPLLILYHPKNS